MRKSRTLSLLLAVAVMATMLIAVPLTASAEDPDPFEGLQAIPNNITTLVFDSAPSNLQDATVEKLIYGEAAEPQQFSENKYIMAPSGRTLKKGAGSGNQPKITVDGTEYTFTDGLNVKNTCQGFTNEKVFAFKTSKACGITIYGSTRKAFDWTTNDVEIKKSEAATNGDSYYSAYIYSTGPNDVIRVGGAETSDTYIFMIKFDWDAQPPATPAPVDDVTVTLDNKNIEIYEDETSNLKATVQLPETIPDGNTGVTWSIDPPDVAKLQNDNTNIITIKPLKSGSATITATSKQDGSKKEECSLKINELPGAKGTPGTVDQLQAATETKIYDLRKAAADGKAINARVAYKSNCLYENNELFVANNSSADAYTGLTYRDSKSSTDIDGSKTNKDSVRIYRDTDIIALKLSKDSTVRLYVTSGGNGDRYGYIEDKLEDCKGDTKKDDALKNSAAVSSNGSKALLEYTADQDRTIYISGTNELFISQIQVIVPDSATYFGEGTTDTGSYTEGDVTEGVIRFLQPYVGKQNVTEYGMYFINSKGDVEKATIKGSPELTSDSGIMADLYGIKKDDSKIYSAMAYVVIDGETIWSKPINGSIDWNSVKKIEKDESYN